MDLNEKEKARLARERLNSCPYSCRGPKDIYALIPEPKSQYILSAIKEKMIADGKIEG